MTLKELVERLETAVIDFELNDVERAEARIAKYGKLIQEHYPEYDGFVMQWVAKEERK